MDDLNDTKPRISRARRSYLFLICNIFLLFSAILLNFWAFQRLQSSGSANSLQANDAHFRKPIGHCIVYLSASLWSICWHKEDPLTALAKYSRMRFDAELGAPSIFKGPPRKELDKAWNELVDSESFSEWINALSGAKNKKLSMFGSAYDTGKSKYFAIFWSHVKTFKRHQWPLLRHCWGLSSTSLLGHYTQIHLEKQLRTCWHIPGPAGDGMGTCW